MSASLRVCIIRRHHGICPKSQLKTNPRLEYDKIFSSAKPDSFNWKSYFNATGTNPSTDEVLFGHVRYLEQTVAERLFEHGKHIFVKSENDNERVARIELCCQGKLLISYLTTDEKDKREDCDAEITIDDVVTDVHEVEQSIKRVLSEEKDKRRKWEFLDVKEVSKYKDVLNRRLNELIKEGQYFEIQDPVEPRSVYCCHVLANYGGIVVFEAADLIMTVNITDPRCHAMGWASRHQEDAVAYCCGKYTPESLKIYSKNSVPEIIFKRSELKEHCFKIGSLVEVQDAEQRASVYPGHVTEIINSHFVRIVSSSSGSADTREIVAHRGSHGVFPQGYCASIGYQLSIPKGCSSIKGRGVPDTGWSWKAYAAEWGISGMPTTETNFEHLISKDSKIAPMRHVEVFCYQRGMMYAALIHRAVRNLVFIELSCDTTPNPPLMFSIGSDCIFPCGFASTYNIPFTAEPPFLSLPPVKGDGVRFDILRSEYSSKPCHIFQERKPSDKTFVPEFWLKGDFWLPRIYVHPSCRLGPWFVRSHVAALARYYEAGPLMHVFKVLIADLYQCVALEHRLDVQAILNTDDEDVTVLHVKFKWRTSPDHALMRVPVCKSAAQAAGWLRSQLSESSTDFTSKPALSNTAEKRRKRAPKTATAKRRRTQPTSPPPKGSDHPSNRIVAASDDDFSRSSMDEMPKLHPVDSVDFNHGTDPHVEDQNQPCSSSDEMQGGPVNGISKNVSSPSRSIYLETDVRNWDQEQLVKFIRKTFPDLNDIVKMLQREKMNGAKMLALSQEDCIDSLGLNLGPALRLYEVIQELKAANHHHL
ncbi:unnamed protein product [Nippostrongylus brasiliensis]|uniref:SLED domain-containing protein n=1 Tax=Nippostrongylus brasiliensis TaxID=27835 RepID=A0A158QY01_NIPBR|nr:unnamed protein product [Nippostrongylus brasiliensis]